MVLDIDKKNIDKKNIDKKNIDEKKLQVCYNISLLFFRYPRFTVVSLALRTPLTMIRVQTIAAPGSAEGSEIKTWRKRTTSHYFA
jgi:hypothetical protein